MRFHDDGTVRAVVVDGVEHAAGTVVLALGPWTDRAQRWLALPQVLGTRMASAVLGADLPAQVVFSEFVARDDRRVTFRIYPRAGGAVYVTGHPAYLATAHGSWGLLTAPPTGRMIAEMILDGASHSLDASPFALTRLPAGRMSSGMGDSAP